MHQSLGRKQRFLSFVSTSLLGGASVIAFPMPPYVLPMGVVILWSMAIYQYLTKPLWVP